MEKKCKGQVHGVTCSPLSPGIPGMPREPTIAGPGGPLSPYNKYSIRHIWWTNHGSLCIWISVSCSAIQEQHCCWFCCSKSIQNISQKKEKKEIDKINRTVLYVMKERLCNESVKLFDKSVRKEQSKWSESWTKLVTTHILSESALITHLFVEPQVMTQNEPRTLLCYVCVFFLFENVEPYL